MFDGGDQDKLITVGDAAVAVRPTGTPGTPDEDDELGTADASDDTLPVPAELIADTRYT